MKKLIGIFTIISFVAIAGTWSDLRFLSDEFMSSDVALSKSDAPAKRYIASNIEVDANDFHFPVNEENSARINGIWTITKYTFQNDEGEKLSLKVRLELVGNAKIKIVDDGINNDDDQVLDLVRLTDQNEMRLEVRLGGGTEVLDLVLNREKTVVANNEMSNTSNNSGEQQVETELRDVDLVVVSAHDPSQKKAPQVGGAVAGNIVLVDGVLEELNVAVEEVSLNISGAEVKTAGIFNTEFDGQPISGRYTVVSESSVKVRFFSGPLAGTIVEFGTEQAREEEIEKADDFEVAKENNFAGQMVYDRTTDRVEFVAETEEEMEAKAEESGFEF